MKKCGQNVRVVENLAWLVCDNVRPSFRRQKGQVIEVDVYG